MSLPNVKCLGVRSAFISSTQPAFVSSLCRWSEGQKVGQYIGFCLKVNVSAAQIHTFLYVYLENNKKPTKCFILNKQYFLKPDQL